MRHLLPLCLLLGVGGASAGDARLDTWQGQVRATESAFADSMARRSTLKVCTGRLAGWAGCPAARACRRLSCIIVIICSTSTGFGMKSFIPAARHCSRSAGVTPALIARIGSRSPSLVRRMRVAV